MTIRTRFQSVPAFVLVLLLMLAGGVTARAAEGGKTYTVTANLYCPGELNTQLPGVTAYLTNGNNPLGIDGYEAVAPTTPVSQNASLTVNEDGVLTLNLTVPNPVFTLQKISGCSNAVIVSAPRDSREYATTDGSVSRDGRITSLTLTLSDTTGKYIFTDCTEFPTLLGVDWTVPLTLEVDFTGIDLTPPAQTSAPAPEPDQPEETPTSEPAPPDPAPEPEPEPDPAEAPEPDTKTVSGETNLDALNAIIAVVEDSVKNAIVSQDGLDVEPKDIWVTQESLDALQAELAAAKATMGSAADQSAADAAAQALTEAHHEFSASARSGGKVTELSESGAALKAGTYTVSCNIWFNKADTGLPLNPHITNETFPPYNPVLDNAALVVDEDGNGTVTIPVVISGKVMTVRNLTGLDFTGVETDENGVIHSVSVELGRISTEDTVITRLCTAEIQMGDLAMSISGLSRDHTWPAVFELNLSGLPTTDGGSMPVVEVEMMNAADAGEAMSSVKETAAAEPAPEPEPVPEAEPQPAPQSEQGEPVESDSEEAPKSPAAGMIAIALLAVIAAVVVIVRKKAER